MMELVRRVLVSDDVPELGSEVFGTGHRDGVYLVVFWRKSGWYYCFEGVRDGVEFETEPVGVYRTHFLALCAGLDAWAGSADMEE